MVTLTSAAPQLGNNVTSPGSSSKNGGNPTDATDCEYETPQPRPKAVRRGTATTAGSSSSTTKEATTNAPLIHEKAQRRVSFTATTKMDPPPSVVETNQNNSTEEMATATNEELAALEYGTTTHAFANPMRRSFLDNIQTTTEVPDDPYHPSFPQTRLNSPYRPGSRRSSMGSRRSSLDSCSSYGSGVSSACYSGTDLDSILSMKDETFQRNKLLSCLEWTSRHVSRHLMQQLMQQVQKEKLEGTAYHFKSTRRLSTSSIRKSTARQPRRHSQPASFTTENNASASPKTMRRSSCSFVHCDTHESVLDDKSERRHEQRRLKTQESMDRLSSFGYVVETGNNDDDGEDDDDLLALGYESHTSLISWAHQADQLQLMARLPPSRPHKTAVLMVDISGFTKLSTTLPLQALSQTINAYFQSLIECVKEYGGDVVRFAGDAVMAEWRIDEQKDASGTRAVKVASACACRIIERCSDYRVYQNNGNCGAMPGEGEEVLTTLNVHCGVGYGTVIAFHAGDDTRREYMLLGDPIQQAAEAIALGRGGDVVASPQSYKILEEANTEDGGEHDKPQVIFSSRQDRLETPPKLLDSTKLLGFPPESTTSAATLTRAVEDWDLPSLHKLQKLMSLYVHSAVTNGELFTTVYHNHPGPAAAASSFDSGSEPSSDDEDETKRQRAEHDQRVYQAEAEIRKVFTLFLQPLVDVTITGDPSHDNAIMPTLNEIMVLANRELARFKGHLRQYIMDDKGIVLIANFGLRGSMCPRMVEDHAMPFAASIQSVLRSELDIECRMGATYSNAYCGVVGGIERHEYAVLGPAVNLAARLMGNPENRGFLVDEGVRRETHGWTFNAGESVEAKGYSSLVPIFEPIMHKRSSWKRKHGGFVGREEQVDKILDFSDDVLSSGCSSAKMVLISAASGFGKSNLLAESFHRIQQRCIEKRRSQLVIGQICCEDDLFKPMSVLGPILLDVLAKAGGNEQNPFSDGAARLKDGSDVTHESLMEFHAACEKAGLRKDQVDTIHSLVLRHEWPEQDADSNPDASTSMRVSAAEEDEIARSVVSILLQATVSLDLVLLGLDDVYFLDSLSWKILQLWFEHACNLVIVCSSKLVDSRDINMAPSFWDYLFSSGVLQNRFLHVDLPPMTEFEIQRLISQVKDEITCRDSGAYRGSSSTDIGFAHEIYLQSGGNPRLAAAMVERFAYNIDDETFDGPIDEYVAPQNINSLSDGGEKVDPNEHILQRMDAVSAVVRTHLNLCALIGDSFKIEDIVAVMEKYRGIDKPDREEHAGFVRETLSEAVWHGILEPESKGNEANAGRYRFTHALWREKILQLTLDSWQQDMRRLIEECAAIRVGVN